MYAVNALKNSENSKTDAVSYLMHLYTQISVKLPKEEAAVIMAVTLLDKAERDIEIESITRSME